ncbi:prepilin-type N-terminal cleavage/methylation domain-containing protein [Exiguobacterium alkaliphilum]|uniref:prepilin-type N-terminal cleavage/methylation domain-containing protein n=1 Tax=Exiguobacterium alkaliphilum TaxID=1428684 RepID=UPI001BA922BC|nr:prepilin-type N-terminal cleavage/methylation domain-containing protein [Exiguobacterium alkaliphilum]QUE85897.1 prepilin-type N-terminal cleavage/methylation domain-containing protein [Exiguobacterium alkaliphilum]
MRRSEQGFTLVEVLVSIVVVSILALAMMNIFSQSLRITSSDLDRTVANQIAQNTFKTIERRAADMTGSFDVATLLGGTQGACELCNVSINGREFDVDITPTETTPGLLDVHITVTSETLLKPITLKGVVTNATLREKFPETGNPEAATR